MLLRVFANLLIAAGVLALLGTGGLLGFTELEKSRFEPETRARLVAIPNGVVERSA